MNEELILLEKLQEICDDMDNMICTTQKPFIRLKLMEIISELDMKSQRTRKAFGLTLQQKG